MSYAGGFLTTAQANAAMGYGPRKMKAYWDARAQACRGMADEGSCLARVARHVPVTIGGLGTDPTPADISNIISTTAALISAPDATLRVQGPRIVTALDTYVVGPLMDKAAQRSAPYLFKYVIPVFAGLYVISGVAAYYSWLDLRQDVGRKGLKMNPRRRRRAFRRTTRR